jgi:hypothetical protein
MMQARVAVSYYPTSSYIGISTNTTRMFWADVRLQTNTFVGFSNIELSPKLNLKRTEMVKIYTGLGINLNIAKGSYNNEYVNGYFVSAGIMVSPFKKVTNLSFVFEASPYINYSLTDAIIRTTLGITWQFKKRSKPVSNPQPVNE